MYVYIHIYIIYIYTRFKSKIHNQQVPRISTSKNLFKEIESVNGNAPGKNTSFEHLLVG